MRTSRSAFPSRIELAACAAGLTRAECREAARPRPAERLLWSFLQTHADLYDHAIGSPASQCRNDRLNEHLNASPREYTRRLRRLTRANVVEMCRGVAPIYVRSRWHLGHPTVLVRVDADEHAGSTGDGERLCRFISDKFADQRMCHIGSPRGHSGYLRVVLPLLQIRGEWRPALSKRRVNEFISRTLGPALRKIAAAEGYRLTGVESMGGFNVYRSRDDGTRILLERAKAVKLANLCEPEDIVRLLRPFDWGMLERIVRYAAMLPDEPLKTEPSAPPPPPARRVPERPHKPSRGVRDTGDVFTNSLQVCSIAVHEAMRQCNLESDAIDRQQVEERAERLYVDHGLARGSRDAERDVRFAGIIEWMLRTFDSAAIGKGGIWFTWEDIQRAAELCRSRIPRRWIDKANTDRDVRGKIDYIPMGILLVTLVKNAVTSGGACPVAALVNMLRCDAFRVTANDDFVRHCIDMLRRARLIDHDNKWWSGRCRRYKVAAIVGRHLPFLIGVKLPLMDESRIEQAGRYLAGGASHRPLPLMFSSQTVHRPVAYRLARHQDQGDAENAFLAASTWLDEEENRRS